jgi:hypothetical protein
MMTRTAAKMRRRVRRRKGYILPDSQKMEYPLAM